MLKKLNKTYYVTSYNRNRMRYSSIYDTRHKTCKFFKILKQCCAKEEECNQKNYFSNFLKLFKFSLFRSPTFVVICVSSLFQSFGWLVPFMYLACI